MEIREAFARALRLARLSRNLTQEDFGVVSSRTYVSALERGLKSPTLEKIEDLAAVMQIHPVTLVALAYAEQHDSGSAASLLEQVRRELEQIAG